MSFTREVRYLVSIFNRRTNMIGKDEHPDAEGLLRQLEISAHPVEITQECSSEPDGSRAALFR